MSETEVNLATIPEELTDMFKEEPTQDIEELSQKLIDVRIALLEHAAAVKKLEETEEAIEASLSKQMIAKNLKSIRRKDGILLTSMVSESFYIKGECKENFFGVLKTYPDDKNLIKEEMNWKTLQGYMETLLDVVNAKEFPDLQRQEEVKKKYAMIKDFLMIEERKTIKATGLKNKVKGVYNV